MKVLVLAIACASRLSRGTISASDIQRTLVAGRGGPPAFRRPPRRADRGVGRAAAVGDDDERAGSAGRRAALSSLLVRSAALAPPYPRRAVAAVGGVGDAEDEPPECRNGAIVAETAVPGAYQQVCMTLPERRVTLKSTGDTISVLQGATSGTDPGGTVSGRTGVAVWNSCLLLVRVLDAIAAETGGDFFRGKAAMELGCGTGLASVALARLGAREVVATDGNPEVVGLARANARRNGASDVVRAEELRWGMLDAADYYGRADVVVGSDLTYNSGSWRVLAETLGAVLDPEGVVIYLALGHSGFSVSGEMAGFLSVIESEGLESVEEGSSRWPLGGQIKSLAKLLEECTSPEEKAVVNGTGGARVIILRKKQISDFRRKQ